ncbi:MAG: type II toxin-antitoxin system RelE/ParE family toxin [Pseudanabaena sp. CAN_BIN31]|nr:type II toxin-antitoxin system RelE/ParE family toxin [Pseudanabaena sp. CAN_BIN31]
MRVKLSKNAIKFLNSLSSIDQQRIREKLKILLISIEESGSIPFQELDIKNLKGEWKGYQRMRVGKMRVIFCTSVEELLIYEIDFRGDIYKKK